MKKREPTFSELCDAVTARPAPRSQTEWRATSTAMRMARRACPRGVGRTIYVECGSFRRRIYLESSFGGMRCYNGPGPLSSLGMIGHHRVMYQRGLRDDRLTFAKHFARACRREGPVPMPTP